MLDNDEILGFEWRFSSNTLKYKSNQINVKYLAKQIDYIIANLSMSHFICYFYLFDAIKITQTNVLYV